MRTVTGHSQDAPRLAIVLADLARGGIGKMRVRLANAIAREGVAVDLLLARTDSPYLNELGASVRLVKTGTSHGLFSVPRLALYLRKERPSRVLTQRIRVNVATLRARRLAAVDVPVWTTLNTNLTAQLASLRPAKARKHLALLRRWYPRNDGLIAITDGVATDAASLISIPRERLVTIHNPVVTPELERLAREPVAHRWLTPGEPPVVLGVGRLEPQKDFATLIDAFALLRADRECRLVILGEGQCRARLMEQVARLGLDGQVDLPGFVDNPYAWMLRAALFAFSSRWEGFGNALAEAMACGTPVVATDCPDGPREILDNGRYGPLVPVGDSCALAAAMRDTLDAPPPSSSLREGAARFSLAHSAACYLSVLGLGPS
jgi:glycosyltransferase involved in cell wall biosynthesis